MNRIDEKSYLGFTNHQVFIYFHILEGLATHWIGYPGTQTSEVLALYPVADMEEEN